MPRTMTWHLPVADIETKPYWDAAAEGKLLVKHCSACDRAFFYPREHCPRCWSKDTSWREASGRGIVYTFTVIHQNDLPPFKDRVPYVIAIVELEEGLRMTTNIEGIDPGEVRCGLPVQASFRAEQRDDDTVHLPVFRPA
ncbi:MAG TPA: Zn-ribbon domain-containing OB-fold protein [Actinomycetota bacterium]|jgi:hypothetical protein